MLEFTLHAESKFELIEEAAFTGTTSVRLKGNHIKFRGTNGEGDPLPARQPIPAANEQIDRLVAALDFLDVWNWKSHYDPVECGYTVFDGMSWSFSASIGGRECKTAGSNAFPSFLDAQEASLDAERYAFLVYAIRSTFAIDEHRKLFG